MYRSFAENMRDELSSKYANRVSQDERGRRKVRSGTGWQRAGCGPQQHRADEVRLVCLLSEPVLDYWLSG